MTRINAFRTIAPTSSSVSWGKQLTTKNIGALVFAAILIVCSLTVGCSNDKPQPISNNQVPVTQPPSPTQPEAKPAPKKAVHKKPATVNYTDQNSGLTFEYPRRYAIETGSAATDLLASTPLPMNFVQPGGVALAAVELPETSFANTDFSSAFFDVSINKALTADQCSEFAVPQPKVVTTAAAPVPSGASTGTATATPAQSTPTQAASAQVEPASSSKLMLGDIELRATEAVSGEGARQSDSKYFHVFQNGACYEFALNVTTDASEEGVVKHVDRDKVFNRLEQIMATVKINPVVAPEVTAEAPTPTPAETPAQ
ncbi:MAG: hypothetical protein DMG79_11565 [Acidobacteria bacterium]|nr:MAG: hypothetical protein DMG79_11565 [Acidobacteriota bacterium]